MPGILHDNLNLLLHHREIPVHYFSRYLFKKGMTNIRDYVPNGLAMKIAPALNDGKVKDVLDNKLYFSLFYGQFDLPLPKILMYNHRNRFIAGNNPLDIGSQEDFRMLIEDIFMKNPGCSGLFIKKTYSSASGRNIHSILRSDLKSNEQLIRDVYSGVKDSAFIFQEKVKQHQDLEKLSPASLNTIRFDTFIDEDGKIATRPDRHLDVGKGQPQDLVAAIVEAARLAPSAENAQPWRFVIVRDPALRLRVTELYEQTPGPGAGEPRERIDEVLDLESLM